MFAVWALSPHLFGILEPWDTPYPVYSAASLLGGAFIGSLFPHRILQCFLGAWAGQLVALVALPGHDPSWFLLGLITTGIGSSFLAAAAAVAGWLRTRSAAQ
jgi:hypothetical protein